jgi:hypothetical protein
MAQVACTFVAECHAVELQVRERGCALNQSCDGDARVGRAGVSAKVKFGESLTFHQRLHAQTEAQRAHAANLKNRMGANGRNAVATFGGGMLLQPAAAMRRAPRTT